MEAVVEVEEGEVHTLATGVALLLIVAVVGASTEVAPHEVVQAVGAVMTTEVEAALRVVAEGAFPVPSSSKKALQLRFLPDLMIERSRRSFPASRKWLLPARRDLCGQAMERVERL